ncbi:MAG: hypothetical protein U5Q44_05780 [Dehalococcoidia bacterium]|nr:hypothetical protein [Dehalococcoidia bacterium]
MEVREKLLGIGRSLEPVAVDAARGPDRAERIEERQALDAIGPVDGELEGDDAAPVMADDVGTFDAKGIHEVDDIAREQVAGDAATRLFGLAEATGIGSEHCIARFGEGWDLLAPLVGGLGEAVDEDDRRALALLEVVHADVARLDEVRLQAMAPGGGARFVPLRRGDVERMNNEAPPGGGASR